MKMSIERLASTAFDAWEMVRALEMTNVPDNYDDRKKAFVKLAEARCAAAQAQRLLDEGINQ